MGSIMIVSSSPKGTALLVELLKAQDLTSLTPVTSGGEARRKLVQDEFEMVIINTPLSDEFGQELAYFITERTEAGVIMLVKSELMEDIGLQAEDYGVFVVEKPIGKSLFYQAIKLVITSRRRMLGLKKENLKLQNKIEEIRLVNRAKCVLIEYLNMSEEQAHKYIEKQAMDRRTSRKSIAENILKVYRDS